MKLYKHQELALEQTKVCSKCSRQLAAECFGKSKINKDGLNSWCKSCYKVYMKQYNKSNKEIITEHVKIYHQVNKESIANYKKSYDEKNKNKIANYKKQNRENKKESIAKQIKNWKQNNKDKVNITAQKRRTKKLSLPSTLTIEQWESIKLYFNNSCCYCGQKSLLTQEHFLALSKGGEYTINNIVPSCKRCNSSKGNREFANWYSKQKYYSKKRESILLEYLRKVGEKHGNEVI